MPHEKLNTAPPSQNIFSRFFNRLMGRAQDEAPVTREQQNSDILQLLLQRPIDLAPIALPQLTINMTFLQETLFANLMSAQAESLENLRRLTLASERTAEYGHFAQLFFQIAQTDNQEVLIREIQREIQREFQRQSAQQAQEAYRWWQETRRRHTAPGELAVLDKDRNAEKLASLPDLEIPEDFICGISREIMTNPVYDRGCPQQKFDLLVIREWLKDNPSHPMTRQPLQLSELVYDEALKERINAFVASALQPSARPM